VSQARSWQKTHHKLEFSCVSSTFQRLFKHVKLLVQIRLGAAFC
jgi:hypothetical protein